MPNIQEIENASQRIKNHINDTPIVSSHLLNDWLGHEIHFKLECFQKVGAFKARGACNSISWLIEKGEKPDHIVANSSGNHAQSVAWAASRFGIPTTIFMPRYSSPIKIQATQSYGAKVVLSDTRDESDELVKAAATEKGTYWLPPFNHEQVIAGQGTVAFDIFQSMKGINAIFAPCGGGGLMSGTYIATKALSPETLVFGAEPLNANDAAESLRKNSIQRLKAIPDTLADGAMTMAVGDITFEYLKQLDGLFEVEESDLIYWTQWLNHLLKVQVEPTSAMSMGAVIQWLKSQQQKQKVMVILTGGNVDPSMMNKIWEKSQLDQIPGIE
ncbi:serine/threonine dehydratase [Reichenbachiella ulvae]|uniref:Serine/threonine dehydratase n=1 Tax=Reichenbachiella ulvae TaxID=2980104 RepID=A0ABT3CTE2_9BACT|nr:serine/threonine dehydratase [Reichenbachiella ulvae]MCV9386851.1 serine/threonine dehydratase [Reichenbachiella ulvae]